MEAIKQGILDLIEDYEGSVDWEGQSEFCEGYDASTKDSIADLKELLKELED